MANKCLYCYKEVNRESEFHEACTMKFFGTKKAPLIPYSIDQMAELAKHVVERSISVPGVQAKLSMSLVRETQKSNDTRLTVVGAMNGNYIFKPPVDKYPEMPQNEHLTMRLAEMFGIKTVPSSLIRLQSGELSYLTRRVDRTPDGEKIHMIDMFQILEAFDKYKSSMEKVGKALGSYSDNTLLDKLYLLEITVFSFLTGNNDMHLKNFSLIETQSGWALSPAYDLLNVSIINPGDTEELALSLEGRKRKLTYSNFINFGQNLGLTRIQIERSFQRFSLKLQQAEDLIVSSFLSKQMIEKYLDVLNNRKERLFNPVSC